MSKVHVVFRGIEMRGGGRTTIPLLARESKEEASRAMRQLELEVRAALQTPCLGPQENQVTLAFWLNTLGIVGIGHSVCELETSEVLLPEKRIILQS